MPLVINVYSNDFYFFFRAVWKFGQTRFVIALTLMALSMFFQFAGPSLVLKAILDYIKVLS